MDLRTYEEIRFDLSLFIPFLAAISSGVFLLIQIVYRRLFSDEQSNMEANFVTISDRSINSTNVVVTRIRASANAQGGMVIYAFKVARFLGCLALLSLSVASILARKEKDRTQGIGREDVAIPEYGLAITFWYNLCLATFSLYPSSWNTLITRHNNAVFLVTFGVYSYRDIWPLATYSDELADVAEGLERVQAYIDIDHEPKLLNLANPRHHGPVAENFVSRTFLHIIVCRRKDRYSWTNWKW
ncbi:hypothetical protein BDN70DRAFT_872031 [Pholiota conissans]|uniref:Uncharacterized protein n=1 Tax=Pholiota conissans TaxID=109636 RepID=A0A9P5ZE54_9AGAR|nr:hypothetical protein BDN70DRAFT_872031 [Pholiota conissans]